MKLYIDKIYIQPKNSKELEVLTNPEFYKKGINYIDITIEELIPISKKFFEKNNQIKQNQFYFILVMKLINFMIILNYYSDIIYQSLSFYLQKPK